MSYKYIINLLAIMTLFFQMSMGQIAISFVPAVYGQSLEGLSYARIMSTASVALFAKVAIRVTEAKYGMVITVKVPSFKLNPGMNYIDRSAFGTARFGFGRNSLGSTLNQTGRFLEGDYEYCYEVEIVDAKDPLMNPVYENCFTQELQPSTPLLLMNPVDGDVFCNKRPQFLWQPPMPLPSDARFRLVLTAVRDRQDIAEAVNFNPPLVNESNLFGNTLIYPPSSPDLVEGQQYAWQVIAYVGQTIIARSEVWTFRIQCNEPLEDSTVNSYRELKPFTDGNFYVATQTLHFSLINPYGPGALNYRIDCLSDPSKQVNNLPALKMAAGLNKYDVNLSGNSSFESGKEYLIRVTLANKQNLSLRFIYKDE